MTTLTRRTVLAAVLVLVSVPAVAQQWPPELPPGSPPTRFFNTQRTIHDPLLAAQLQAWPLPAYCLPDGGRLTAADLAARYPACRGE